MKGLLSLCLLLLSITSSAYFIEKTQTSMTISLGVVKELFIDDMENPVPLALSEKVIMGKHYRDCGEPGTIESKECEQYYTIYEDIVISVKKYVVRNKVKFALSENEQGILQSHRGCQNELWKNNNDPKYEKLNSDELKAHKQKIIDLEVTCKLLSTRWNEIKKEGGERSPDVVQADDKTIWDRTKNYFFGKEANTPEMVNSPETQKN